MKTSDIKKNVLNFIILFIVLAVILYFSLGNNFDQVIAQISSMNYFWLLIGIILVFGYWVCKAISLYMVIKLVNNDYSFLKVLRLTIITQFFNGITPFASGGQPGQIYLMSKDGIKATTATNVAIQHFIFYQIALIIYGILAILYNYFFDLYPEVVILKRLVLLGFIANMTVMIVLFVMSFCKNINKKILDGCLNIGSKVRLVKNVSAKKEALEKHFDNFYESATLLKSNIGIVVKGILINFLGLTFFYATPVVILYGFGLYTDVSIMTSIVTSAYVMIIGSFVPIPGGSGGIEYGFTRLFGNFLSPVLVSSLMLVWRGITYYFGMILGSLILFIKRGK